ncbi:signal transduction histidine kinase [Kibdelosporangium banguiense]|uniref:histidine kinase n=1 Tax=Kibdelosporangium banguiense TaxID=1365924 RepID=A0ABS4TIB0_9PSEU|nr:nitrate- and nitrite sensing domain-containing protein [Kibdelosporangium banguiense]MBP2324162.1 signal transduction histidine kinase [Kibdelosporangium banguiense]
MTSSSRARILRWRDWHLRTKLAAVTLVPLVFVVALGAVQIHGQVARAESYRRVDRLVALSDQLRHTIGGLQQERAESARLLVAGVADPGAELRQEYQATDVNWAAMSRAAESVSFVTPVAVEAADEVGAQIEPLSRLRRQVYGSQLDGRAALTRYTEVVGVMLALDRALAGEITDPALSGTAHALHNLQLANEEIYLQQALVTTGMARGVLTVADMGLLRTSQARLLSRTADFRATASRPQQIVFNTTVSGAGVDARDRMLDQLLQQPDTRPSEPAINMADWQTSSQLTTGAVATVAGELGRELSAESARLQREAGNAAGLVSVILFAAMLLAAAVVIIVGRQLVGSLRILRRSALEVADHRLPEAVAGLRAGALLPPEVAPVPVHTKDELGQVARAFDAVQDQALRLAAEQAHLRASYGDVFVNLSRRSQGLVQRQLHLLDRLERDEEDPDQLATLFQLDHLATRMRRNNENLMVLSSGSELARRAGPPVQLADLLRAAVSEIEQYQRVVVQPPPSLTVVGYAARDLVRLTAELLDNATAYSAPETKVTISSRLADDGTVSVDVLDSGIGMREEEIEEVNARLAEGGQLDASASRRMGLFVVGRLAGRHGVRVELHGGKDIAGIRATMTVPVELMAAGEPEEPYRKPRTNGHTVSTSDVVGKLTGRVVPAEQPTRGDLFATAEQEVTTGWWEPITPDTEPPAERGIHETTPIFDEMISAWFTGSDTGKPVEDSPTETWEFAADKGFQAAQVVAEAPLGVTAAGLPQRVPREKLVPGSISDAGPRVEARGRQEAEALRARLGGLQNGLSRARLQQGGDASAERVMSVADKGFQAAEAVTKSPEGVTSVGLPQRVPREKLVPGSIASPPGFGEGLVRGERGAQEVRGRLDELQRGLSNGRRSLAGNQNGQESPS